VHFHLLCICIYVYYLFVTLTYIYFILEKVELVEYIYTYNICPIVLGWPAMVCKGVTNRRKKKYGCKGGATRNLPGLKVVPLKVHSFFGDHFLAQLRRMRTAWIWIRKSYPSYKKKSLGAPYRNFVWKAADQLIRGCQHRLVHLPINEFGKDKLPRLTEKDFWTLHGVSKNNLSRSLMGQSQSVLPFQRQ